MSNIDNFETGSISKVVLKNAIPAIISMLVVLIYISRQGLIFMPLLFILNKLFGLNGLVFSQPIADFPACIIAFWLYRRIMRKNGD